MRAPAAPVLTHSLIGLKYLSENLGTTAVIPVATVDAFLNYTMYFTFNNLQRSILNFSLHEFDAIKTILQGLEPSYVLCEMCK